MSLATFDPKVEITLSDSAISHISKQLENVPEKKGFRLYLATSGCSGFMY